MKCNSCRLLDNHHDVLDAPGDCDQCWGVCHNKVAKAKFQGRRCDDCWKRLAEASVSYQKIAEGLLAEKDVPIWVLERLSQNPDAFISMDAQKRLNEARESVLG